MNRRYKRKNNKVVIYTLGIILLIILFKKFYPFSLIVSGLAFLLFIVAIIIQRSINNHTTKDFEDTAQYRSSARREYFLKTSLQKRNFML